VLNDWYAKVPDADHLGTQWDLLNCFTAHTKKLPPGPAIRATVRLGKYFALRESPWILMPHGCCYVPHWGSWGKTWMIPDLRHHHGNRAGRLFGGTARLGPHRDKDIGLELGQLRDEVRAAIVSARRPAILYGKGLTLDVAALAQRDRLIWSQ
jgi:hypothetical protein